MHTARYQRTYYSIGSVILNGGAIFAIIFNAAMIALEFAAEIAIPFGNGGADIMSMTYWVFVLTPGVAMIPLVFFVLGVALASAALLTAAIAFYFIICLWQLFAVIWFIILLVTCDGTLQCASNMLCDGTTSGTYTGPTIQFIVIFAAVLVMLIAEFVALCVAFAGRRVLVHARMRRIFRLQDSAMAYEPGMRRDAVDNVNMTRTAVADATIAGVTRDPSVDYVDAITQKPTIATAAPYVGVEFKLLKKTT